MKHHRSCFLKGKLNNEINGFRKTKEKEKINTALLELQMRMCEGWWDIYH